MKGSHPVRVTRPTTQAVRTERKRKAACDEADASRVTSAIPGGRGKRHVEESTRATRTAARRCARPRAAESKRTRRGATTQLIDPPAAIVLSSDASAHHLP